MTLLALPFTTKVTLEEGSAGTMVGFVEAGLADVVDSLDDVVGGWPLGVTVDFWHNGFWKKQHPIDQSLILLKTTTW